MSAALQIDWATPPPAAHYALSGGPSPLKRTLRTHRVCADEHRQIVLRDCLRDHTLLPRWHQDDRYDENAHRGIHVLAPAGAYSRIPVWSNRSHWLQVVVPAALSENEALRRQRRFSADLFMRWARVKAAYADPATGRRCIVRPKQLASVLGVTQRQVQILNRFARDIGLEKVVLEGRMLTADETDHCRKLGSKQRGLATEVALTVPRRRYPQAASTSPTCFTPTSGTTDSYKSTSKPVSLHGLTAKKKGPAPPALRQKAAKPRHPAMQLARDLTTRLPWLSGEQPGRLAPALTRFAAAGWTADDVATALDDANTRRQIAAPTTATIRTRPAVVLATLLRQLDIDADQPSKYDSTPAEPCGHPDCDGNGWRSTWDSAGNESVYRCPECPTANGRATKPRTAPPPGPEPRF